MAPAPLTLCYHAVSEDWAAPLSVTPQRLERQLQFLLARGYRAATFLDVASGRAPAAAVAITFDDALSSVARLALPILTRLGMTGTIFVPTDYPGSGRPMAWPGLDGWVGTRHEHELECMPWDELRELRDRGWEVGSHTCSHPALSRLDDAGLRHELTRSREVCSAELGVPCAALAFPYGDHDERVVRAARDAGYAVAGTLSGRFVTDVPLRSPRVGVYRKDGMARFALKIAPLTRGLRSSGAWGRLDARRSGGSPPEAPAGGEHT
jgi:peptidoglycan/xylan/chitin deacetylase (PgdA/CDA1 family)